MLTHLIRSAFLLSIVAAPIAPAQADAPAATGEHDFKAGSPIKLQALSPLQVENLAVTGKVWGFLKYHHPAVTAGQHRWDGALLDILPAILAAENRQAADAILQRWIVKFGPVADCDPCASLDQQDFQLLPNLKWLDDTRLLNPELRKELKEVYRKRSAGKQYYVSLAPGVENPVFDNEPDYKDLRFPDAGFQLLSLFRLWNIIEYWAPYRDQLDEDWDKVLRESIAPVALAQDRASHELAMIALIARIHDTHTNLWSSLQVRPPVGRCHLPVRVRFIEGRAMVSAHLGEDAAAATGLKIGDTIEAIGGVPVDTLLQSWKPYFAASNEPTRLRDMGAVLTKGDCGPVQLTVRQDKGPMEMSLTRVPRKDLKIPTTNDRAGDTFQLLGKDVAYIKLSSIKSADIPGYMEKAAHTKGLVIDIRNYPSAFVPFALGQYLVDKPTPFARFTVGDLGNPGGFKWGKVVALYPQAARYAGKVMILVDDISQSQSEYTAMALRAAPRARVVGSTTAGADGNASWIPLPGGLRTMISGIGVFYPDKRPTQRIGIVPDIEVKPTIAGIRAGRDEVLEAAIAEIQRQ
ncbi:S41 family peptidase [Massilia sp. BHUDP2]|uniref:S41 family peptidase n=1 Tax=Massilia sp. BHUDP2 TaxID=3034505 RepID=UPI0039061BCC